MGGFGLVRVVALMLLLLPPVMPPVATPGPPWREAPEYIRLFAPRRSHTEAYSVYRSPLGLDAVLRDLQGEPALLRPPQSWQPRPELPFDAFGQTGNYDRWKVARLYGSRRARVARGPKAADGRVTESWTLISPYPSPALDRLEEGTLLIVLKLP